MIGTWGKLKHFGVGLSCPKIALKAWNVKKSVKNEKIHKTNQAEQVLKV